MANFPSNGQVIAKTTENNVQITEAQMIKGTIFDIANNTTEVTYILPAWSNNLHGAGISSVGFKKTDTGSGKIMVAVFGSSGDYVESSGTSIDLVAGGALGQAVIYVGATQHYFWKM